MEIIDNKTGIKFKFDSHKQKEEFFNLWDKYEIQEKEIKENGR
tara:strand:+ start:45 stop:173 length:129 start_codon:yes stop_codon:yes gene_type:complete